ncbi:hypothetical protein L9F63_016595, partial [Diploptera punctata]
CVTISIRMKSTLCKCENTIFNKTDNEFSDITMDIRRLVSDGTSELQNLTSSMATICLRKMCLIKQALICMSRKQRVLLLSTVIFILMPPGIFLVPNWDKHTQVL